MKDLSGQKFNYTTIVGLIGYTPEGPKKKRRGVYECLCDCGNTFIARGKDVKQGKIKSCGCYHIKTSRALGKSNQLPNGDAALREVYRKYFYGARRRGIEFEITEKEFKKLTSMNCHYCGIYPERDGQSMNKLLNSSYKWNGLDRVDSNKEYTIDNVVPCCKTCNYAKHTLTQGEFLSWIKRVYEHQMALQNSLEPNI